MFFTRFIIAGLTVTTALSLHDFHALNPHVFGKRQEYQPSTYTCGAGATCEIACGAGSVECGDALCINPDLGHVCCEPGSADPWGCLDNDYCLVDGWCCPKEQDPQACALANGVTLPPDFVGPTTSAAGSNVTSVVASPTSGVARPTSGSTKPTSVSSGLPEFTGAASLNTVAGGSGFLYAVLVMVGNAF
ncbi:hypothetical protein AG0111_0g4698 [Alternaria gaisen]|uniref:Uncharacterized protein n=1 Tax=Alternaria gaisen TaxID=167740 RepID=A0ACB6FQB1_9PLEO|nr:hypothetical protein AG0111_0g4698 [Alternaria gaisen]